MVFLIDLGDSSYQASFDILYTELSRFSPELIQKPRILAGTKTDLEDAPARLAELRARYPQEQVYGISVFSGEGLAELAGAVGKLAAGLDQPPEEAGP